MTDSPHFRPERHFTYRVTYTEGGMRRYIDGQISFSLSGGVFVMPASGMGVYIRVFDKIEEILHSRGAP